MKKVDLSFSNGIPALTPLAFRFTLVYNYRYKWYKIRR